MTPIDPHSSDEQLPTEQLPTEQLPEHRWPEHRWPEHHWLDASLEEVVGGRRPPDLSARILRAWQASQGNESLASTSLASTSLASTSLASTSGAISGPRDATTEPEPPPVISPSPVTRPSADLPVAAPLGAAPLVAAPPVIAPPLVSSPATVVVRASSVSSSARAAAAPASAAVVAATLLIAALGAGLLGFALSHGIDTDLGGSQRLGDSLAARADSTMTRRVQSDLGDGRHVTKRERERETPSIAARSPVADGGKRSTGAQPGETVEAAPAPNAVAAGNGNAVGSTPRGDRPVSAKVPPTQATDPQPPKGQVAVGDVPPNKVPLNETPLNEAPLNKAPLNETPPNEVPLDDAQLVAWMNGELERSWRDVGVRPAEQATDEEWCRRVFLRLLGRIPTVEEVRAFAADGTANKRERLVDELMGTESRYASEFAAHWAEVWTNVLIGRQLDGDKSIASRDQLVAYLKDQLAANRPLDAIAYELISATGSNEEGAEDYNGAVNFLLAHAGEKSTQATARVARVFLGRNLQCGQCHVGPEAEDAIAQQQFWQLNAFFRQMQVERLQDKPAARLVNRDFRGDGPTVDARDAQDASDAAVFYELGDGKLRAAYPVFLDGSELPRSGQVDEVDRRRELAQRVARSPEFRRTIVNRIWAHFLGFGIVNPLDDLSPHNPASHPELLDRLSSQLAARGYDMRSVARWIVLSRGFGLSSKGGAGEVVDSPELGKMPLFSRYYARPMPAEQLYESLKLLAGARRNGGESTSRELASREPAEGEPAKGEPANRELVGRELGRGEFLGRVTRGLSPDRGDGDLSIIDSSIIQTVPKSLMGVDGELPKRVLRGEQGSLLEKVARNDKLTADQKIDHLFEAALARRPTAAERQAARELLKVSTNDPAIGLRDLWWALLNSNEFLLDH